MKVYCIIWRKGEKSGVLCQSYESLEAAQVEADELNREGAKRGWTTLFTALEYSGK